MLIEMGIGDAYGAKFENIYEAEIVWRNNDLHYDWQIADDYQPSLMPPGHYTDDTQMSLAIAEAMLDPDESWSNESLAEWFVEVFHRNQRRGYTTFFLNALLNAENGAELLVRIDSKSTKSGAAMRSAPLGLYSNIRETVAKAKAQASVTHDTWKGRESSVAVAMAAWYFYHNIGPKEDLVQWLNDERFGGRIMSNKPFDVFEDDEEGSTDRVVPWTPEQRRPVRVDAWECIDAAFYAIESADNLSDILRTAVGYTGDVDTVGCIAMGIASVADDIENNLPEQLYNLLENQHYGRRYLQFVDQKLFEAFPKLSSENKEEKKEDVGEEQRTPRRGSRKDFTSAQIAVDENDSED